MPADACPPVPGKVTWHPSVKAWAVHIKGRDGKTRQKRVGLQTTPERKNFVDHIQGVLCNTVWSTARRAAYEEAVRMWNAEDFSTRERIEFTDESSGGAGLPP